MSKFLYEVRLERGKSNPEFGAFVKNAISLNAKAPDYGGINNVCIVSHHMNEETVRLLFEEGLKKNKRDLSVTEITRESLEASSGHHKIYLDIVEKLFLPHDSYPNIK